MPCLRPLPCGPQQLQWFYATQRHKSSLKMAGHGTECFLSEGNAIMFLLFFLPPKLLVPGQGDFGSGHPPSTEPMGSTKHSAHRDIHDLS